MGPGSSRADYDLAGVDFEERWPRFEAAVRELAPTSVATPQRDAVLEPRPLGPDGPPIWIGSWGSPAGLRRVVRLGDGWLASAYNTTPEQVAAGRAEHGVSCSVATMWTYVTDDRDERGQARYAGWPRCCADPRTSWPAGCWSASPSGAQTCSAGTPTRSRPALRLAAGRAGAPARTGHARGRADRPRRSGPVTSRRILVIVPTGGATGSPGGWATAIRRTGPPVSRLRTATPAGGCAAARPGPPRCPARPRRRRAPPE